MILTSTIITLFNVSEPSYKSDWSVPSVTDPSISLSRFSVFMSSRCKNLDPSMPNFLDIRLFSCLRSNIFFVSSLLMYWLLFRSPIVVFLYIREMNADFASSTVHSGSFPVFLLIALWYFTHHSTNSSLLLIVGGVFCSSSLACDEHISQGRFKNSCSISILIPTIFSSDGFTG